MSRLRNGAAVGKRKAIDLSGLSLTCLQLDGEGMGEKKKKRGAGWSLHDTPRLSVCHLEGETGGVRGSFRSFRSLLCILKWFNYGRLCIWTATTVFFFPSSSKDTRSSRLFVDSGGRLGPSILGVDCIMVLCLCLRSAPPCSGRE